MAGERRGPQPRQPQLPDLHVRLRTELGRIDEQLHALVDAMDRMQGLLDAVVAISREVELTAVLHRIVTTAMELVGARYGALGVLNESGEHLEKFITAGLSERERTDLAGTDLPRGLGVLGPLISHPEPHRIDDIEAHPASVGFPPGHPRLRTLLGVAISVRGEVYGDLYLSERRDGQPFDIHDENVVTALAGAAGIAIENVRLFEQVRVGAEQFQRLLLPALPDLRPFSAAAVYRPAAEPPRRKRRSRWPAGSSPRWSPWSPAVTAARPCPQVRRRGRRGTRPGNDEGGWRLPPTRRRRRARRTCSGLRTAAVVRAVLAAGLLLTTSLRGHRTSSFCFGPLSTGLSRPVTTEPLSSRRDGKHIRRGRACVVYVTGGCGSCPGWCLVSPSAPDV
ncbi:GAF domain-containing protein [Streptomyces venetus]|uniref:GAF domain-containing protein n=1 Tax=Streptomyces venetus TaxID=1701086 RepID=UPI003C2E0937